MSGGISMNAGRLASLIRSRRSVRQFAARKPSPALIRKILEAGRWAPSGLNNQPWRFLVVSDSATREKLSLLTKCGVIIRRAPLIIAVCLDTADSYNREKDLMAVGACVQNMLLTSCSLGLGACWLGEILNRRQEAQACLRLDNDIELTALLAVGYPSARKTKGRRKPLDQLMAGRLP